MSLIKTGYDFLVGVPRWFGYDSIRAKRDGIYGLDFWGRELAHFIGGYLVGLPFRWSPRWMKISAGLVLVCLNVIAEAYQAAHGQVWYKAIIDPSMWWLGYLRGCRFFEVDSSVRK